jgi:hypothetical protein
MHPSTISDMAELLHRFTEEDYAHVAVILDSTSFSQGLFRNLYGEALRAGWKIEWNKRIWKRGKSVIRFLGLNKHDDVRDLAGFHFTHIVSRPPSGGLREEQYDQLRARIRTTEEYAPKLSAGWYYIGRDRADIVPNYRYVIGENN